MRSITQARATLLAISAPLHWIQRRTNPRSRKFRPHARHRFKPTHPSIVARIQLLRVRSRECLLCLYAGGREASSVSGSTTARSPLRLPCIPSNPLPYSPRFHNFIAQRAHFRTNCDQAPRQFGISKGTLPHPARDAGRLGLGAVRAGRPACGLCPGGFHRAEVGSGGAARSETEIECRRLGILVRRLARTWKRTDR